MQLGSKASFVSHSAREVLLFTHNPAPDPPSFRVSPLEQYEALVLVIVHSRLEATWKSVAALLEHAVPALVFQSRTDHTNSSKIVARMQIRPIDDPHDANSTYLQCTVPDSSEGLACFARFELILFCRCVAKHCHLCPRNPTTCTFNTPFSFSVLVSSKASDRREQSLSLSY